jgi:hypothetical protein
MPWTWPGLRELAPAAFVAALVVALGWQLRAFPLRALAHVQDAYGLEYQPAPAGNSHTLRVSINPGSVGGVPTQVGLYSSAPFGFFDPSTVTSIVDLTTGAASYQLGFSELGAYYQIRAELPDGNLALSPAVWVPGEQVVVLIDALPWARVTIEGDQAPPGVQTTPFSAALKPGATYQLRLENGGVTPALDQSITVPAVGGEGLSPSERAFRITMPGFDPNEAAARLSSGPATPRAPRAK